MTKSKIALLAALFATCSVAPALADWDTIGTIEIGPRGGMYDGRDGRNMGGYRNDRDRRDPRNFRDRRDDRDVHSFDLGGPVERLQLRADRSDVMCRSVDATFDNGRSRNVFSGPLREGRSVDVDIPGRSQNIRRLDFNCDTDGGPATIRIIADIGGYRDQWRRSPEWQTTWSKMFNWGSNMVNNWQMIGSESFDGRNDSETSYAGRRGLRVSSVALKPLETDARCSRVTARFDNGKTQNLALHNGDLLRQGQYEKLDLPGDTRDLASLDMRCRAVDARHVTIQIFIAK